MHSQHPTPVTLAGLRGSMDRRNAKRVQEASRTLWATRDIEGSADAGYRLTNKGFDRAVRIIQAHLALPVRRTAFQAAAYLTSAAGAGSSLACYASAHTRSAILRP
jgi:hypothetical protein